MQIFILFYFIHLFLCKSIYSSTVVFEHCGIPLFLVQESRDVFVVFIEIILSPDDVFDSNFKTFW